MTAAAANRPWNLESFLDSLIVELDRARDTLAVKAMTRPLSYSVQDVDLELQIFPQFDGKRVSFVTAEPGQEGSSGLRIQLGSITARGMTETASEPVRKDDVSIESIEGVPEDTKQELRKLGIKSAKDLEKLEERNVDLEKVTSGGVDYGSLAGMINKARRRQVAPAVRSVSLASSADGPVLALEGEHLDIAPSLASYPRARLDGRAVRVVSSSPGRVEVAIDPRALAGRSSRLNVALDPFAVVTMEVEG